MRKTEMMDEEDREDGNENREDRERERTVRRKRVNDDNTVRYK